MRIGVVLVILLQSLLTPIASAITIDITSLRQDQLPEMPSPEKEEKNLLPVITNTHPADTKVTGKVATSNGDISTQEIGDTTPPDEPTATPEAGTYNTTQEVTLTADDDSGLDTFIYYTVDESDPRDSSTRQLHTSTTPISVDTHTTITAVAYDAAMNASKVVEFSYVIDKDPPEIKSVQYFSNGVLIDNDTPTNESVIVEITTNEPVKPPDGWRPDGDDKTYTKQYDSNDIESITVEDLAGNESAEETIEVKGIDKDDPTIFLDGTNENNVYTSTVRYMTSDNVEVSSVTINDLAAPQSDTISSSGTYTIIVTDTAGNEIQERIFVFIPIATIPDPETALTATTVPNPISPLRRTNPTPVVVFTQVDKTDDKNEDNDDENEALSAVSNTPGTTVAAIAPSSEGWKILGIAWYWLLLAFSLIAAAWWVLSSWYRARQNSTDVEL